MIYSHHTECPLSTGYELSEDDLNGLDPHDLLALIRIANDYRVAISLFGIDSSTLKEALKPFGSFLNCQCVADAV